MKKIIKYCLGILLLFALAACDSQPPIPLQPATPVVEKPVTINPPPLQMNYQLAYDSSPALRKAYQEYIKTGKAPNIVTEGFEQFAYAVNAQPIVAASVFELTVISLEPGENVTNVSSGDPLRWSYSLAYSGVDKNKQAHVMIKPAQENISTDLVITTDRRMYTLKLVSTNNGKYVKDVRFWYPLEMQKYWENYNAEQSKKFTQDQELKVSDSPNIDLNHLNFSYSLKHNNWNAPDWMPIRVFDDGIHTYIQFPSNIKAKDMPALFILNEEQQELVNYRTKIPYFVVDKIFKQAVLVIGVGDNQSRVTIVNSRY